MCENDSMSHAGETFFTVVGCMDGRVQDVVAAFGREKFGAKFPDTITEAGLVGQLAKETPDQVLLDGLKFKIVAVSLSKHQTKGVVVNGHAECAGNPVEDEKHKEDIQKSVFLIQKMVGAAVPVLGVFVKRNAADPSQWKVEELA